MSSPVVIHVVRPYADEEEYLARESESIDAKSMVLIDQPALPFDTAVVFDIQLGNGNKPIRAEAKVMGPVAASSTAPGGLRVRFKRFGAATKAFIDRAVALRGAPAPAPAPEAARPAPAALEAVPTSEPEPISAPLASPIEAAAERGESSGVHRRPVIPVGAPANREELLQRLRVRLRDTRPEPEPKLDERTG